MVLRSSELGVAHTHFSHPSLPLLQVGKSAFVRAMLRDMGHFESDNFDPAAMSNGRYLPVESAMPGTTLGIIPLQAFASGGTLYGKRCGRARGNGGCQAFASGGTLYGER